MMTLLEKLSSALGMKTQDANKAAAEAVLREPHLLEDIADGLQNGKAALIADCAEVMTKVAEVSPLLVVPHINKLAALLTHGTTKVRWEAVHAIALTSAYAPASVVPHLRTLTRLVRDDSSTIVRDYAIDALCHYGSTDHDAATTVLPALLEALEAWGGKHRARILEGLARLVPQAPAAAAELEAIALTYIEDPKASVKKAARALSKALKAGTRQ
ncbi:hypothetical protein ACFFK0_12550 [Paenibacillus chartarius]|uniref:HEAT repeat domain-containing protein n=1 Tax=Paenibacillus chartarius TaxID=747481 RepID=A0ABV6DKV7_9BACL